MVYLIWRTSIIILPWFLYTFSVLKYIFEYWFPVINFYENKKVINQTDLVTSYHPRGFLLATILANSTWMLTIFRYRWHFRGTGPRSSSWEIEKDVIKTAKFVKNFVTNTRRQHRCSLFINSSSQKCSSLRVDIDWPWNHDTGVFIRPDFIAYFEL